MSGTGIGARIERTEDKRFITGNGRYTDDINLLGQVYACFVRSPHAHAKITDIDVKEALALEGVVKIFTGKDMEADGLGGLICGWMVTSKDGEPMKAGEHPPLASERVRYVGDCVAVVIGESREVARLGAEAVSVSYEELDAVVEPAQAQNQNAPKVHDGIDKNLCFHWQLGDKDATDAAFDKAAHVTRLDIVNNRLIPNAIEPRAALGDYNPGSGDYTLYTTSQNPHVERLVLSAFVGIAPEHKLRVVSPDVGGGFGSKIFVYAEETACLWAAGKIRRPVKWTAERSESFLADAHGRDHVTHAELALDSDGRFLALRAHTVANLGAYLSTFSSSVPTYLYGTLLSGQYDIGAIHVEVEGVYTHTAPVDAYRGAGRPEATFVVERLVECAARETNKDPVELRKKNFITKFPHQTPVILNYDIGDYNACINRAVEMIDYKGFDERRKGSQTKGKLRGIGFSTYIEACGLAPSSAAGSLGAGVGLWESAEVRVNPTGNVEVLTGAHSHGQGHETSFAQLVSERLTIPIEDITIVHGDTASV
ncbi:MAG: xanthine dehydrogenase family protein molybdopterin-binding subunit, partial [Hyphomicrobiales bacterium]|nr:xanthine dehydrogenase family protein molybdopterin-binding subunit [Hyphomicrobiales bacterium]